jgi:trimeric autotransporter adhesin
VDVKCAGDAAFATLSPRQPLTPTPYALALPGLRTEQSATSPNIIGGAEGNTVTSGAVGASLSGGGVSSFFQAVTDDYGTIGGGRGNTAGDNSGTTSDAIGATVGGGEGNSATGSYATIPGGLSNSAGAFSMAAGRRAKAVNS